MAVGYYQAPAALLDSNAVASRLPAFLRRRRVVVGLQLAAVVVFLAFFGYVLRDVWADALPRLADADPVYLVAALGVLAAYYLLFAVGWWWLLAALGVRVGYGVALQAEMASMLAKYIGRSVDHARADRLAAARRGRLGHVVRGQLDSARGRALGRRRHPRLHRGPGAVDVVDAPLVPLFAFAAVTAILLHPRVFTAVARVIFRRFDAPVPARLPYRILVGLLGYYAFTWLVGGTALYLILRSLDADPGLDDPVPGRGRRPSARSSPVLTVFAPSGLGVREASMYGLLVVVVPASAASGRPCSTGWRSRW